MNTGDLTPIPEEFNTKNVIGAKVPDPKMLSLANDLVFERFKKDTEGPPRRKIEEIQQSL